MISRGGSRPLHPGRQVGRAARRSPTNTNDNDKSWQWVARRTKINSSDPSLTAVWTAYPAQPLLALFHPPIELASSGPRGCLNFNRWIDCTAIRLAVQTRIEILHSGPVPSVTIAIPCDSSRTTSVMSNSRHLPRHTWTPWSLSCKTTAGGWATCNDRTSVLGPSITC